MNKPAPALALSEGQRQTLQTLSRSTSAAHRLVVRSRALLLAGDGVANARIAAECGVAVSTVVGWRRRAGPTARRIGAAGRWRRPAMSAGHRAADLVGPGPQAASGEDVQAVQ